MATISVCMIVKNEEHRLAGCLDSLTCIADEIIIVDTGSMDDTKEIAAKYTDKIYDFKWIDDFAAARNFAFSKAGCDYIYSADADELIDEANQFRFKQLKELMLPEIDIVQMKYINMMETNTAYNSKLELRPKLYKRLRTFTWIDPIHETVLLDPVIYDSEIEIQHMAEGNHAKRDIKVLLKTYDSGKVFSKKLHGMYAKELFIAGDDNDFLNAKHVFEETIKEEFRSPDERKEAACVLAHCYRLENNSDEFFKLCLKDIATTPCAEICMELGEYFYAKYDYEEACIWFQNAATETESIISIRTSGDLPLRRLSDCYNRLAMKYEKTDREASRKYIMESERLSIAADAWELPSELM